MTSNPLFGRHLAWCKQKNLRPMYITTRRRMLLLIERELGVPLELATYEELKAWFESLDTVNAKTGEPRTKPATQAAYLSHASAFYEWLLKNGSRDDNPTKRLDRPRLQRRLPRPIAAADLSKAIEGAPDDVRPWLLLAALMGLRSCEIAVLRAEDIDGSTVFIREGKGGKDRVVAMNPAFAAELEHLPREGCLFPHWDDSSLPMKPHNVSHRANRYLHSLGIRATMHQLRHAYATALYQQSQDIRLVQEMCGHADPRTTAGYAGWDLNKAIAAVAALRIPAA